jgi:hypothetical protein
MNGVIKMLVSTSKKLFSVILNYFDWGPDQGYLERSAAVFVYAVIPVVTVFAIVKVVSSLMPS